MTSATNYRQLESRRIIATIDRLATRIEERFPGAGLATVCSELLSVARQAQERAEWIARPIRPLRIGIWVLVAGALGIIAWTLWSLPLRLGGHDLPELVQTIEAGTNELILLGAGLFFLVSLERRLKRGRALQAIHELRSIAHIIDMHQLTKDPERLLARWILTEHSPRPSMDASQLSRYLDYCSEMLSLTGKVAALYVQVFNDEVAVKAVNEVETLTTGLSRKIWQKILILDSLEPRLLARGGEGSSGGTPPQ